MIDVLMQIVKIHAGNVKADDLDNLLLHLSDGRVVQYRDGKFYNSEGEWPAEPHMIVNVTWVGPQDEDVESEDVESEDEDVESEDVESEDVES